MKRVFLVFFASLRRDIKNYSSYKFSFIGEIFSNFILVLMLFFVSKIFDGNQTEYLRNYDNNYFIFLLTGSAIILFLSRVLSSATFFVANAQSLGFFETLVNSKSNLLTIIIGSLLFPIFQSFVRVLIIFIFALYFKNNSLYWYDFFDLFVVLFISIPSIIGISLMIVSAMIIYKKANFLNAIFLTSCLVFSGIIYPVSVLPDNLHFISTLLPSTYAVELVRSVLIYETEILHNQSSLLGLFFTSIVYLPIGIILMNLGLKKAKKDGSLSHF